MIIHIHTHIYAHMPIEVHAHMHFIHANHMQLIRFMGGQKNEFKRQARLV